MPLRILVLLVVVVGIGAAPASAAPPVNDTSTTATVIDALPYAVEVDTSEATLGDDDLAIGCTVDPALTVSHSVWFAYTPAEDETIAINTFGSSYAVGGAVVPAENPGAPLACFPGGTIVALEGGTTYLIDLVELGDAGGGTLRLSITGAMTPLVTLDQIGRLSRSGVATLTGTITCEPEFNSVGSAVLTQVIGRRTAVTAFGFFSASATCDGTPQPWSMEVTSYDGRALRPGPASLELFMSACDELTFCANATLSTSVVLHTAP